MILIQLSEYIASGKFLPYLIISCVVGLIYIKKEMK
jgi:hypothetical protein